MKKLIMFGIIGIILISFASAGLVGFLSNSVSANVEVNGPIFYTASHNKLIMNEEPSNGYWNGLTNGQFVKREWVMEDGLGGIDFYNPKIEFVANVKINDDFNVSRGIYLEFGYYASDGNKHTICSTQYLSITQNETINVECSDNNAEVKNVERFYYDIEALSNKNYEIKTKDTYVKVLGVVN